MRHLFKWYRYVSHIPLRKIAGKLLHSLRVRAISYFPTALISPWEVDPPIQPSLLRFASNYQCMGDRFTDTHLLEQGSILIKGIRLDFGSPSNFSWDNPFPGIPERLHIMHDLAFFSFSMPLVKVSSAKGVSVLAELIATLEQKHRIGSGNLHFVWSPIALSLRILGLSSSMAIACEKGEDPDSIAMKVLLKHISYCAGLLDSIAERYLEYNHNAFSATALVVAACALGASERLGVLSDVAASALCKHVLDDGFWEERSPTYHIHMMLLSRALLAMGHLSCEWEVRLSNTLEKMQVALSAVVHSDGEIAVFNDAAIQDSVSPSCVGWRQSTEASTKVVLPTTGYALMRQRNTTVVFDAGVMGPDDVIGHGHGDFLSVEVCWHGRRLIVDPGVRSISGGNGRYQTRSAKEHNGPGYKELEPAEFFGTWRVGRRGAAGFSCDSIGYAEPSSYMELLGWCDGYAPFVNGKNIWRRVRLYSDGSIEIQDSWPSSAKSLTKHVAFLIPTDWLIRRIDCHCFELSHASERVYLSVDSATLLEPRPSSWNPMGPVISLTANVIPLDISSGCFTATYRLSPSI